MHIKLSDSFDIFKNTLLFRNLDHYKRNLKQVDVHILNENMFNLCLNSCKSVSPYQDYVCWATDYDFSRSV